MINRALVCTILIAAGVIAALNSKAPADTAAELQPAVCSPTLGAAPREPPGTEL